MELGLNLLNWLTLQEAPVIIRPKTAPDQSLNLSDGALSLLAAFFLVVMPGGLLVSGWLIWHRRRRR